jgi:hypothetical protein
MTAVQRLGISVSTLTVVVMYAILRYLLPALQNSPAAISRYLPFLSNNQVTELSAVLVTALAAAGTYKLLASILLRWADRWSPIKSAIFGASYLEGTWIGQFQSGSGPKLTVEHFEQKLSGIVIRGLAENEDASPYASWISDAVSVDRERGRLVYNYNCDLFGSKASHQGIGVFQFERLASWKAPFAIIGYAADLPNGDRSANHEYKISDKLLPTAEAFEQARKRFK